MKNLEHQHAVNLMRWWAYTSSDTFGVDGRLLVAIPNGGHRHIGTARKLKAEGVRPGVPDYCLFVARKGYHGLLIELKEPTKGKLSPTQDEMIRLLSHEWYLCVVAKGWDEAREAIQNYLLK